MNIEFQEIERPLAVMYNGKGISVWWFDSDGELHFFDKTPQNFHRFTVGTFTDRHKARDRFINMIDKEGWELQDDMDPERVVDLILKSSLGDRVSLCLYKRDILKVRDALKTRQEAHHVNAVYKGQDWIPGDVKVLDDFTAEESLEIADHYLDIIRKIEDASQGERVIMNAKDAVNKFGKDLIGKQVRTEAMGDWKGGAAEVIEVSRDEHAPEIVMYVRRGIVEMGVFGFEQIELKLVSP